MREGGGGKGDLYNSRSLKLDGIGIFEYRQTVMLFFLSTGFVYNLQ